MISGLGILLRGPSGSGKSDLALRLIDGGGLLVADDQVEVRMGQDGIVANAPANLAGLLEIRGIGILRVPSAPEAPVALVADLVPAETVERLPDASWCTLLNQRLPRLDVAAFETSAPAKLRFALSALQNGALVTISSCQPS